MIVTPPDRPPASPSLPRGTCLEAVGVTHPGLIRAVNEDAYLVDASVGLFAVCDGVGGCAAGEVASRVAIDTLRAVVGDPSLPGAGGLRLLAAVEHANTTVYAAACADPARAGMGTTLTALLVRGGVALLAHVGDTRAYLLHGRRLDRLSDDHTLASAHVRAGIMTADDALTSDMRHVITRAIGTNDTVEIDTRLVTVQPQDTLVLCSDGLHDAVGDREIAAILLAETDLTRAATRLIERANDHGGADNITTVLVRIVDPGARR